MFVGTARSGRSHWLWNLRAEPRVRYWLAGREHMGTAFVFADGAARPASQMLPPLVRVVAEGLLPGAIACGWQFAVISPERVEPFLQKLPVDALWGVGPVTARKLRARGIERLVDVRTADARDLHGAVGSLAEWLQPLKIARPALD